MTDQAKEQPTSRSSVPSSEGPSSETPDHAHKNTGWRARVRAKGQSDEQARILRTRLLGRMALLLVAWTALFALLCVFFELFISDSLGNRIADATSSWIYSTNPTYEESTTTELATEEDNTSQTSDSKVATRTNSDPWEAIERGDTDFLARYDNLVAKVGSETLCAISISSQARFLIRV